MHYDSMCVYRGPGLQSGWRHTPFLCGVYATGGWWKGLC